MPCTNVFHNELDCLAAEFAVTEWCDNCIRDLPDCEPVLNAICLEEYQHRLIMKSAPGKGQE